MCKKSLKRQRLVEAASNLIYENGFSNTSLADIAKESGVPLGNVYYYFKSKESLAKAVIDMRKVFYLKQLEALNRLETPAQRLLSFLDYIENDIDSLVKYGCPVGSLCQELDKCEEPITEDINDLIRMKLAWATKQFSELHFVNARSNAIEFLSSIQGAILMATALGDKSIVLDRISSMRRNLKELLANKV